MKVAGRIDIHTPIVSHKDGPKSIHGEEEAGYGVE